MRVAGLRIAWLVDWWYPRACWVDIFEWARGERAWGDINHECRDAEISKQPACWCGKLSNTETPESCKQQINANTADETSRTTTT